MASKAKKPDAAEERHHRIAKDVSTRLAMVDTLLFAALALFCEIFFFVIYAVWFNYEDFDGSVEALRLYPYTVDVSVMIFFGFGFLMTFLRRYGYGAIGFSLFIAAFVCQWSVILQVFFETIRHEGETKTEHGIGVYHMLNGLFCSGAVLISFGAVIGKVSPAQLLIMAIIEPVFYWLNIFLGIIVLEAWDVGGGMTIHTFGAYFGLTVAFFFTSPKTRGHADNSPCYISDIFSFAGSILLWIYWPSFNAVIAPSPGGQARAMINTFLSLCSASVWTFVWSRLLNKGKLEAVHIQNSCLAGGVVMGVVADVRMYPAVALMMGGLAGTISVFGYQFLTPFLNRFAHLQDICGVNNLHGMPGVLGSLFAVLMTGATEEEFPHGSRQPGYQISALAISLGLAFIGGLLTSLVMRAVHFLTRAKTWTMFQDRGWWELPSYSVVALEASEPVSRNRSGESGLQHELALLIGPFLAAAARGDLDAMKDSLADGKLTVDSADYDQRTALHIAAADGHFDIVKWLLDEGANPAVVDRWGGTPLSEARRTRNENMIALIESAMPS